MVGSSSASDLSGNIASESFSGEVVNKLEIGFPSTVTFFDEGMKKGLPLRTTTVPRLPGTFSFDRTISLPGSLPIPLTPSFNQNKPTSVSQPLSLFRSAQRFCCQSVISFAYAAGSTDGADGLRAHDIIVTAKTIEAIEIIRCFIVCHECTRCSGL